MSEKSKWFDPKEKVETLLPPITQLKSVSNFRRQRLYQLLAQLRKQQVQDDTYDFFSDLVSCPPNFRLKRNLTVLLRRLCMGWEGLYSEAEKEKLVELARRGLPQSEQEVAFALLNTYERYQAQQAMLQMFRDVRAQRK